MEYNFKNFSCKYNYFLASNVKFEEYGLLLLNYLSLFTLLFEKGFLRIFGNKQIIIIMRNNIKNGVA